MSREQAERLGAKCQSCPLGGGDTPPPVFSKLNRNAKLIALAAYPGKYERITNKLQTGRAAQTAFWPLTRRAGIPDRYIHVTNALLCSPPFNAAPALIKQAVACCRPRLHRELVQLAARHIAAMGNVALSSVAHKTHVASWMGAPLGGGRWREDGKKAAKDAAFDFSSFQVHPMYQPAFVARRMDLSPVLAVHLARAWRYATGRQKDWRWPSIVIDEGPEMYEALRELRHSSGMVGSDVETSGPNPLRDSLLNVGLSNKDVSVSVQWGPASERLKAATLECLYNGPGHIGQNYQFDLFAFRTAGLDYERLVEQYFRGFELLTSHRIYAPTWPHKLAFQACYETHAPRWKDEYRSGSDEPGAGWLYKPENAVPRAEYNAKDAYIQWYLGTYCNPRRLETYHKGRELYGMFRKLDRISLGMTLNGICISRVAYDKHKAEIARQVQRATDIVREFGARYGMPEFNPASAPQMRQMFVGKLEVIPRRFSQKTGEPSFDANALEDILASDNLAAAELARNILHLRSWVKLDTSYISGLDLHSMGNGDIGVHASWNPSGTKSNRWSSQNPPMQTIPKGKTRVRPDGSIEHVTPGLRDLISGRLVERKRYE